MGDRMFHASAGFQPAIDRRPRWPKRARCPRSLGSITCLVGPWRSVAGFLSAVSPAADSGGMDPKIEGVPAGDGVWRRGRKDAPEPRRAAHPSRRRAAGAAPPQRAMNGGGEAPAPAPGFLLLAAVALLSASALGYEILLTRLLAIVQWHHFAFLVISIALLGFGASGAFLLVAGHRLRVAAGPFLALAALAFALAAPACFALAQHVPFNVLELPWSLRPFGWLLAIELLLAIPFFIAATGIGRTLIVFGDRLSRVYAADLVGAGGGAALAVGLLWWLPAERTLDGLGAMAALAGGSPRSVPGGRPGGPSSPPRRASSPVDLRGGGVERAPDLAIQAAPAGPARERGGAHREPVRPARPRERGREREGAAPVGAGPQPPCPRPGPRAGGPLRHGDGRSRSRVARGGRRRPPISATSPPPFPTTSSNARGCSSSGGRRHTGAPGTRGRGAGGGRGRAPAGRRRHRAGPVRRLLGGRARSCGHPPPRRRPAGVRRGRGRGGVRPHPSRCARREPIRTPRPSGGTPPHRGVDARHARAARSPRDRRHHRLEPASAAGRPRLFATLLDALEAEGIGPAAEHLAWIRSWNTTTLVASRAPLSGTQVEAVRSFARARAFDLVHVPGMEAHEANRFNVMERPWFHEAAARLLGPERDAFIRGYKFDIRPATDDRPYLWSFFKWAHAPEILSLSRAAGSALVAIGYLALPAAVVQAAVASVALILLPLLLVRRGAGGRARGGARRGAALAGFFALGLAFLMMEIAFISRFTVILSHPLHALAVVLAAFLVFAGIGSWLAGRRDSGGHGSVAWPAAGIVALAAVCAAALPHLTAALVGTAPEVKIAAAVALVAPIATFMGMPFPRALARLRRLDPGLVPWAWGVNGCASVVGAVLATGLAVHLGQTFVIGCAGPPLRRRRGRPPPHGNARPGRLTTGESCGYDPRGRRGARGASTGRRIGRNRKMSDAVDREPPAPLLEARGITKRFGAITALDGVDLRLFPSEVLGIVGDNGAGKSTLMKVLSGLHGPTEGEIVFDSRTVVLSSPGMRRTSGSRWCTRTSRSPGTSPSTRTSILAANRPQVPRLHDCGREAVAPGWRWTISTGSTSPSSPSTRASRSFPGGRLRPSRSPARPPSRAAW